MRTQTCGTIEARARVSSAGKFLEVASLIENEDEGTFRTVGASLAVLAGIAEADAACCSALGRRSHAQDHHQVESLISEISPGGADAASALHRLLDLKDTAHYGFINVSRENFKVAIRQAQRLVDFANKVILR